uniref:Uncharacterized protein n=1 Tax=Odontella aurita TaxID=265563 RepID=A0A7S4JDC2_9STRA|mmetsp:Transcript_44176/g.134512  ORF Transcript_44176/g.134512 Transcript_44176/m.134512 type:complete len:208 (+) Transcript_44176:316-939(+)
MTFAPRIALSLKRTRRTMATQVQGEKVSIDWGEIDAPCSRDAKTKPQNEMDLSMHSGGSTASATFDQDSISSLENSNDLASKAIRAVRFGAVEIREYPRVLGDNPCVSSGPPLALGWEHLSVSSMDLESYESSRPFRCVKDKMAVPHMIRDDWLREAGYSRQEITVASRVACEIKAQRRKSASQKKAGRKADEIRESFGRFRRSCSL